MINYKKKKLKNIMGIEELNEKIDNNIFLNGKILIESNLKNYSKSIEKQNVKVFSQSGEDGIIQYIVSKINTKNKKFVEFGCEKYSESNTRYLLFNNNWSGLIIDGSQKNIREIKKSYYYWKHDLTAINEFIKKDNIESIIKKYNFHKNLGLLSIDIDGNDYWILNELKDLEPDIIICEYNSLLGMNDSITLKYDEKFQRSEKDYGKINYGASIKAITKLLSDNYILVSGNSFGNNIFFVNKKYEHLFETKTIEECYVEIGFNELINIETEKKTFSEKKKLIDTSKFEHV